MLALHRHILKRPCAIGRSVAVILPAPPHGSISYTLGAIVVIARWLARLAASMPRDNVGGALASMGAAASNSRHRLAALPRRGEKSSCGMWRMPLWRGICRSISGRWCMACRQWHVAHRLCQAVMAALIRRERQAFGDWPDNAGSIILSRKALLEK